MKFLKTSLLLIFTQPLNPGVNENVPRPNPFQRLTKESFAVVLGRLCNAQKAVNIYK